MADFGIWQILADRAKVIGGIRYGMKVVDVIEQKGSHFRVNPHAEAGSVDLVYDDVKVSVRQWWPGADQGRVVGVAPVTDSIVARVTGVPYEDEK